MSLLYTTVNEESKADIAKYKEQGYTIIDLCEMLENTYRFKLKTALVKINYSTFNTFQLAKLIAMEAYGETLEHTLYSIEQQIDNNSIEGKEFKYLITSVSTSWEIDMLENYGWEEAEYIYIKD